VADKEVKLRRPANPFMPIKSSGIYRWINWTNGKVYIGSAINLYRRRIDHIKELRANSHNNSYLQYSWNKYGEYNFFFEIIELCLKDMLLRREQFYIDKFKSYDDKFGYNLNPIAGSNIGRKFSEEFKEKCRLRKTGTTHSEETKRRMSEAHTNRKRDPLIGLKISAAKKGKGVGRKLSEETKVKMRLVQMKRREKEFNEGKNYALRLRVR
jgi:group I intron endonuclease